MLVVGCWLVVAGYRLPVGVCRLLVVYCLQVFRCWLLVVIAVGVARVVGCVSVCGLRGCDCCVVVCRLLRVLFVVGCWLLVVCVG